MYLCGAVEQAASYHKAMYIREEGIRHMIIPLLYVGVQVWTQCACCSRGKHMDIRHDELLQVGESRPGQDMCNPLSHCEY